MKFFKLELINREENFNRRFGREVNVGVLQPGGIRAKDDISGWILVFTSNW